MSSSAPWVLLALAAAGGLTTSSSPCWEPFLFASLLAYLGDPLADRLEARGLGRTGAVVLVFLALSLVLTLGLLGFLPLLVEQLRDLLQRLPRALTWLESTARPWLSTVSALPCPAGSAEVNALLPGALAVHGGISRAGAAQRLRPLGLRCWGPWPPWLWFPW